MPLAARVAIALSVAVVGVPAAMPMAPAAAAVQANDPLYPETAESFGQWGLRQVHAPDAWDVSTGQDAVIAVIDNGVDLDHPDLGANLVGGTTIVGCRDPNGCGDGSWRDSDDPLATDGHGTHVAGIAAALTGNGRGVAGMAPDARIMPVNVFDGATADSEDTARGIRWAADHGADVINLSLGQLPGVGQGLYIIGEQADYEAAIAYAQDAGAVVVAAAGNEGFPLCDYPSFNDGVLCVAATDRSELPADYSNLPNKQDQLVVRAPGGGTFDFACGGGIISTVPAGQGDDSCGYSEASTDPAQPEYTEFIGTSMAAPHVSGLAALLVAQGCDRTQVLDLITSTARHPVTGARGTFSPDYGFGIVDAAAAVTAAAAPVGAGGCTQPTGAVTGRVTDASSSLPLAGATVFVDTGQTVSTDGDGRYALTGVPAGSRTVTAAADGYDASSAVTEVVAGTTTTMDFSLTPEAVGTGTITGVVTDAGTGAPLEGAVVDIDTGQSAVTNNRGRYTVREVPAGTRVVTASLAGYQSQSATAEVQSDRRTMVSFSLTRAEG